jgi:hypothetical protein
VPPPTPSARLRASAVPRRPRSVSKQGEAGRLALAATIDCTRILALNSDISLDYEGAADKNRLACDNFVIQRDVGVLAGTEFNAEE